MYNYFEKSAGLDPVLCRPKKNASRVEAQELEKKYGRGTINLESGEFVQA